MDPSLKKKLQRTLIAFGLPSLLLLFIFIILFFFIGVDLNHVPKDELYDSYKKSASYLANEVIEEYVAICNHKYDHHYKKFYPNDFDSNNVRNWNKMVNYLSDKYQGFKFLEFNDSIIYIERSSKFRYKFKYKITLDSLNNNAENYTIHFISGMYDK